MASVIIKIKKLKPAVTLPSYIHPGDVGLEIYSLEDHPLAPQERHIFFVGFALEFDLGYVALMTDRSSLAKNGLHVMGGVYDAGYRGEYNVQLINLGAEPYEVKAGHRIAQLIIMPVAIAELIEVGELSDSNRGAGRFGSTGK